MSWVVGALGALNYDGSERTAVRKQWQARTARERVQLAQPL